MKLYPLIFILLFTIKTFGQKTINIELKRQLDSIMVLDQKYRSFINGLSDTLFKDSIAKKNNLNEGDVENFLWKKQLPLDSSNLIFIEKTISKYGYPGKSIVGEKTNEVAWYIIQHSTKNKISYYLKTIKKAGRKNELPLRLVCMIEDRYLMTLKKKQKYGTQGTCRHLKNGKQECFIWPIKNAKNVNKRRKKAGIELTVEQNATRLHMTYRIVKMSEIK
jgi:hypothetical protein